MSRCVIEALVTVDRRGQMVIPKEVREIIGIHVGGKLVVITRQKEGQFVTFLDEPDSDVIVFDTAPTGKSLRELAMPFDWAGFVQKQIKEGKELAGLLNMSGDSLENLEQDKRRYDRALEVLRSQQSTVFTMVLLPERLPIEETQSAITGLKSSRNSCSVTRD